MEKRETNSAEDLHNILSRFQAWSGKHAGAENGNGHKPVEGVREIPYDEALRQVRSRRPARVPRPAADVAAMQPEMQKDEAQMGEAKKAEAQKETGGSGALPCPAAGSAQAPAAAARGNAAAGAAAGAMTAAGTVKTAPQQAQQRAPGRPAAAKKIAQAPRTTAEPAKQRAKKSPVGAMARRGRTQPKAGAAAPEKAVRAGKGEAFREVLARSVERKPGTQIKKTREPERLQRVSVRLSRVEERHLQECAKRAGMTVSAYLRERALGAIQAESPAKAAARTRGAPKNGNAMMAAAPAKSNSVLGDWIALLRNRFLASPVRFAERA